MWVLVLDSPSLMKNTSIAITLAHFGRVHICTEKCLMCAFKVREPVFSTLFDRSHIGIGLEPKALLIWLVTAQNLSNITKLCHY